MDATRPLDREPARVARAHRGCGVHEAGGRGRRAGAAMRAEGAAPPRQCVVWSEKLSGIKHAIPVGISDLIPVTLTKYQLEPLI